MRRFDHERYAARLQLTLDCNRDLRRRSPLDLQAPQVSLDYAREPGDADDPPVRDIADPGGADDRRRLVLAMAFESDAAQREHLVVTVDFLESLAEDLLGVVSIVAEIIAIGLH